MATIEKRDTGEGVTYRAKVRIKGHPAQSATFARLTDARRWAQSTEAAIRERRYFKTKEAQRRTLADLVDRYTRDVIPRKGPWARDQAKQLAWWRAELGTRTLADVTPAVIAEARDKLARGLTVRGGPRSPSTVVRYLAALSHAFAVAVKEWGWLEDSPLRKVTKPKEPRGRVRYLGDDERGRLLEECRKSDSPDLYCAVVLALSTGGRRMEILGLRAARGAHKRHAPLPPSRCSSTIWAFRNPHAHAFYPYYQQTMSSGKKVSGAVYWAYKDERCEVGVRIAEIDNNFDSCMSDLYKVEGDCFRICPQILFVFFKRAVIEFVNRVRNDSELQTRFLENYKRLSGRYQFGITG